MKDIALGCSGAAIFTILFAIEWITEELARDSKKDEDNVRFAAKVGLICAFAVDLMLAIVFGIFVAARLFQVVWHPTGLGFILILTAYWFWYYLFFDAGRTMRKAFNPPVNPADETTPNDHGEEDARDETGPETSATHHKNTD